MTSIPLARMAAALAAAAKVGEGLMRLTRSANFMGISFPVNHRARGERREKFSFKQRKDKRQKR
jgi:hypothetical protein